MLFGCACVCVCLCEFMYNGWLTSIITFSSIYCSCGGNQMLCYAVLCLILLTLNIL